MSVIKPRFFLKPHGIRGSVRVRKTLHPLDKYSKCRWLGGSHSDYKELVRLCNNNYQRRLATCHCSIELFYLDYGHMSLIYPRPGVNVKVVILGPEFGGKNVKIC